MTIIMFQQNFYFVFLGRSDTDISSVGKQFFRAPNTLLSVTYFSGEYAQLIFLCAQVIRCSKLQMRKKLNLSDQRTPTLVWETLRSV